MTRFCLKRALPGFAVLLAICCMPSAQAQSYSVLYKFTGKPDGSNPSAGLIGGPGATLYGTTATGGKFKAGTVFKLDKTGVETVLYSFTGGADGGNPAGSLIRDSAGILYGTAVAGGVTTCGLINGCGVVFKLDTNGTETVLHSFTGPDGASPVAGLILDSAGNLYGTTESGGVTGGSCVSFGCGVVFRLDTAGRETVLHTFTGPDGQGPTAGLVRDPAGNLYGTTVMGGLANQSACVLGSSCGVVFKLDVTGTETVLHSFTGGADGGFPVGGLILDSAGNLYGTTEVGGVRGGPCVNFGCGVVFKLHTNGMQTVLYRFTGPDGQSPNAGLTRDSAGNLYGTTYSGGASGRGAVFMLDAAGTETVLHSFTGPDGSELLANLLLGPAGNLYGTASAGGSSSAQAGLVFRVKP